MRIFYIISIICYVSVSVLCISSWECLKFFCFRKRRVVGKSRKVVVTPVMFFQKRVFLFFLPFLVFKKIQYLNKLYESKIVNLFRWYFGKIKRIEAEKKLLLPDNAHGAFLVRDSESRRNDYSLSGKQV